MHFLVTIGNAFFHLNWHNHFAKMHRNTILFPYILPNRLRVFRGIFIIIPFVILNTDFFSHSNQRKEAKERCLVSFTL
jgi:hypothetical protein